MSAPPEHLALAAEFPAVTREQWRAMVSAVLQRSGGAAGIDPELALASSTYDGISIKPLYTSEDAPAMAAGPAGHAPRPVPAPAVPGEPTPARGSFVEGAARAGWDVRQRHADPDPGRTNRAALADLTNGATSLWLVLGQAGLAVADLPEALDGVYLDLAPVALDAGAQTRDAARALLALAAHQGVAPGELSGSFGADPIGLRARTGAAADLALLGELGVLAAGSPNLRVASVDATVYHDAGGSDADELGVAAAVGVAYLRALTEGGMSVDAALRVIEFRYAVTADQFLSIAKLRAARRVWDRIGELSAAGADRPGQRQHAVTSAAMMTRRDPWVNLLRTTIACFAAAVGGADAITVAPFDAAIGLSDELARRIARNTQAVLHDESSLARVSDAAGGSWYIESLTDELARAAWTRFTAIERAGGALAALDDGVIDGLLATARAERADDIAHRRAAITGVSEFAYLDEEPVVRPPAPDAPSGGPLPVVRHAQDFEALRDRADAAETRPVVFLAALGPVAAHQARVGFAANLFQAGGIEPVVGTHGATPAGEGIAGDGDFDEIVAAFRATTSTVACLCSANRVYADVAAPAAEALRAAGATHIWLAGPPGEVPGVDGYLFTGVDALDVLRTTLDRLGVA